jgi:hypothetical protein
VAKLALKYNQGRRLPGTFCPDLFDGNPMKSSGAIGDITPSFSMATDTEYSNDRDKRS